MKRFDTSIFSEFDENQKYKSFIEQESKISKLNQNLELIKKGFDENLLEIEKQRDFIRKTLQDLKKFENESKFDPNLFKEDFDKIGKQKDLILRNYDEIRELKEKIGNFDQKAKILESRMVQTMEEDDRPAKIMALRFLVDFLERKHLSNLACFF